ncbi:hypothetical protein BB561_006289, partial [Smittium simulii]
MRSNFTLFAFISTLAWYSAAKTTNNQKVEVVADIPLYKKDLSGQSYKRNYASYNRNSYGDSYGNSYGSNNSYGETPINKCARIYGKGNITFTKGYKSCTCLANGKYRCSNTGNLKEKCIRENGNGKNPFEKGYNQICECDDAGKVTCKNKETAKEKCIRENGNGKNPFEKGYNQICECDDA